MVKSNNKQNNDNHTAMQKSSIIPAPTTVSAIDCELFYAYFNKLPDASKPSVQRCLVKGNKPERKELRNIRTFHAKWVVFNQMMSHALMGCGAKQNLSFVLAANKADKLTLKPIVLQPREHTSTKDTHALDEVLLPFLVEFVFKRKLDQQSIANIADMFCEHPLSSEQALPAVKRRVLRLRVNKYIDEYNVYVEFFNSIGVAFSKWMEMSFLDIE